MINTPRPIRALVGLLAMTLFSFPALAEGRTAHGGDRIVGERFASRSVVYARNGMASTAHPLATEAALDILKAGGSAVDAAIAANAMLGLVEPTGCGIGGDLFAIVWDPATERLHGLNASGRAPQGQSLEALRARLAAQGRAAIHPSDAAAVTVPGAVDGWFELHGRFGKLPMADVLAPAANAAEAGAPIPQTIAYYWNRSFGLFSRRAESGELVEFENARATYFPGDRAPAEGELFANPDLARTYRRLGEGGRDVFYRGEMAQTIDAYFQRIGGPLRAADFAAHRSTWVEPVSVNYRGYDVWELPPNGQGIAALQMLQILEGFDLTALGYGSAEATHLQIEAKRLAFEDRAKYYADPEFAAVDVAHLLSDAYAAERRALIAPDRVMTDPRPGDPSELVDGDTTYLTVADQDGMMVSLIQSNYRGMGTGLVPDGLGFMFQNRGEQFSLEDGHANVYAPGKRPFHTIIPAFVTKDGKPWLSFGLMGGDMQPQGHVQIILNLVDFGMDLQEAGDAARWRHAGEPEGGGPQEGAGLGIVRVETGYPAAAVEGLRALGHVVEVGSDGSFGGYQAIARTQSDLYAGATEYRKDGVAHGY